MPHRHGVGASCCRNGCCCENQPTQHTPFPPRLVPAADALLSLPQAVTNWGAATAGVNGSFWLPGTDPCGQSESESAPGYPAWQGITCNDGQVTQLALPGLGLSGSLPSNFSSLNSLTRLDLSGNAFHGPIPDAWLQPLSLTALAVANLGSNLLGGGAAGGADAGADAAPRPFAWNPCARMKRGVLLLLACRHSPRQSAWAGQHDDRVGQQHFQGRAVRKLDESHPDFAGYFR